MVSWANLGPAKDDGVHWGYKSQVVGGDFRESPVQESQSSPGGIFLNNCWSGPTVGVDDADFAVASERACQIMCIIPTKDAVRSVVAYEHQHHVGLRDAHLRKVNPPLMRVATVVGH